MPVFTSINLEYECTDSLGAAIIFHFLHHIHAHIQPIVHIVIVWVFVLEGWDGWMDVGRTRPAYLIQRPFENSNRHRNRNCLCLFIYYELQYEQRYLLSLLWLSSFIECVIVIGTFWWCDDTYKTHNSCTMQMQVIIHATGACSTVDIVVGYIQSIRNYWTPCSLVHETNAEQIG